MAQSREPEGSFDLDPMQSPVAGPTPAWPMVIGIVVAGLVLEFAVSWLRRGTLPRIGLILIAASLLFATVVVCGTVMRAIYAKILPGSRSLTTTEIRMACLTALWIPSWVLFMETWSSLSIAAGAFCLMSLGYFLKRRQLEAPLTQPDHPQVSSGTPFLFDTTPLVRVLLPSLVLVLLFEASIALAANRWFIASSITAGISAGVLAWRAATRRTLVLAAGKAPQVAIPTQERQAGITIAAFVFTMIALLPYLRVGPKGNGLGFLIGGKTPKSSPAAPKTDTASSDGYVGIIMLPLKEEQKKIVAPVKQEFVPHFGVKISKPMEIPFDGQYWYFKWPDKRPRPTARVVRGSSIKTQVRSSDRYPLLMEAHQKLPQPLDLGCCSAMNVAVENADQLGGPISLELWVKKLPEPRPLVKQSSDFLPPDQAPHYLGTVIIPSSQLSAAQRQNGTGKPTQETLYFPIPAAMGGIVFDEITVVVRPAPERARMGAKVAIKKFVLEP